MQEWLQLEVLYILFLELHRKNDTLLSRNVIVPWKPTQRSTDMHFWNLSYKIILVFPCDVELSFSSLISSLLPPGTSLSRKKHPLQFQMGQVLSAPGVFACCFFFLERLFTISPWMSLSFLHSFICHLDPEACLLTLFPTTCTGCHSCHLPDFLSLCQSANGEALRLLPLLLQ